MRVARRVSILLLVAACGPTRGNQPDAGGNGSDSGGPDNSDADTTGDAGLCGVLTATYRDFRSDHPDFEKAIGDDRGLVRADLGVDGRPIYAPAGSTLTVSGQASFDQWYRDVAGTNMTFAQPLP